MRLLTFFAGTVIVSLLLCMWMRSRQKEMAVFISLGEQKATICFAGSFGSGSRVSHCPALPPCGLGSLGCRKPYRTVAVFCGNRRFSAGFLTIYRYRIAIGDWQREWL